MAAVLTQSVLREELRTQQAAFQQAVARLGAQVQREVREELRRCLGGTSTWGEELRPAKGTPSAGAPLRKLLELSVESIPALEEKKAAEPKAAYVLAAKEFNGATEGKATAPIDGGEEAPSPALHDAIAAMEEGVAQPDAELPLSLWTPARPWLWAMPPTTIKVTSVERCTELDPAAEVGVPPPRPTSTESEPAAASQPAVSPVLPPPSPVSQGRTQSPVHQMGPPPPPASPRRLGSAAHQALPVQAEEQSPKLPAPKQRRTSLSLGRRSSKASASQMSMDTNVPDENFPTALRLPTALRKKARRMSIGGSRRQSRGSLSSCGTNQTIRSQACPTEHPSTHVMPMVPMGTMSLTSTDIGGPCTHRARRIVRHPYFDIVVAVLIMLNGISIGVQTDVMARSASEELPASFRMVEVCFCIVFTLELLLRLIVEGNKFFTGPEKGWNLFDFALVMLQLIEEGLGIIATVTNTESQFESGNFGFVRMLRALRLIRIVRLVRVLRLIGELRTIFMSIASSMKHLFWTVVLLLLMIYICSVPFTQIVLDHRLSNRDADLSELLSCWDSVGRSALTLFEAIFGGIDWDVAVMPLVTKVHLIFAPIFCLYIAFALLGVMNVVTGVFVENAIDSANQDKEKYLVQIARDLFEKADPDQTGVITWTEFEKQLENPGLKTYFEGLGVDSVSAKSLFRLLDMNNSGAIDADELLTGTLRLRGNAKGIDLAALIYESRRMSRRFQVHAIAVNEALAKLNSQMGRMGTSGCGQVEKEQSSDVGQILQ